MQSKSKIQQSLTARLIVHGGNNQICIDSRDIAKEFGRRHDNVLQTIRGLVARGVLSALEAKEREYTVRGKKHPCFELSEEGFFKAMPFIGGTKSEEGQVRLVDAFFMQRRLLDLQSKKREKLAFQVARLAGKGSRTVLTDAIQQFIAYAKKQGSINAERYFSIITSAVHKSVIILEPKATQVRQLMTAIQLSTLSTIELTAAEILTEGMEAKLPYKEIYQKLKNALDGFVAQKTNVLGG